MPAVVHVGAIHREDGWTARLSLRQGPVTATAACHPTARRCERPVLRGRPIPSCAAFDGNCPLEECQRVAPAHRTEADALACARVLIPRLIERRQERGTGPAERWDIDVAPPAYEDVVPIATGAAGVRITAQARGTGWIASVTLLVRSRGVTTTGVELRPSYEPRPGGTLRRNRTGHRSAVMACHPTAKRCEAQLFPVAPCAGIDGICPLEACRLAARAHDSAGEALACGRGAIPRLLHHYDEARQARLERTRERARTRSMRRVAWLGPSWAALRDRVLAGERSCRICGAASGEVDHIVPLWAGGTTERANLQALCKPCHDRKSRNEMSSARGRQHFSGPPDPWVGRVGIAERLGVTQPTVRRWVNGDYGFPPAESVPGFGEYWRWPTVAEWARRTGRFS